MELITSKRDHPELSRWILNPTIRVLLRDTEETQREEEKAM